MAASRTSIWTFCGQPSDPGQILAGPGMLVLCVHGEGMVRSLREKDGQEDRMFEEVIQLTGRGVSKLDQEQCLLRAHDQLR